MTTRRASCSCRQLSAECRGEPARVAVCHCLECKRRTGSAFGVGAWYLVSAVSIEGRTESFTRIGDEGARILFRFCPVCGVTICWEIDGIPGVIAIPGGTFADPAFPTPQVSVYHESRRHRWVVLETGAALEKLG